MPRLMASRFLAGTLAAAVSLAALGAASRGWARPAAVAALSAAAPAAPAAPAASAAPAAYMTFSVAPRDATSTMPLAADASIVADGAALAVAYGVGWTARVAVSYAPANSSLPRLWTRTAELSAANATASLALSRLRPNATYAATAVLYAGGGVAREAAACVQAKH